MIYHTIILSFFVTAIVAEERMKIVQGTPVTSVPYYASIQEDGYHLCGGSVISKRHILTAGHCFKSYNTHLSEGKLPTLTVLLGTNDLYYGGSVYNIAKVSYAHGNLLEIQDDIAVLLLSREVDLSEEVSIIPMSSKMSLNFGSRAKIFGHGSVNVNQFYYRPSRMLVSADMQIIPHSNVCAQYSTSQTICGMNTPNTGPCLGDSGGPLVQGGELIGIISAIYPGDCGRYYPVIYTRVAYYLPWIKQMMLDHTENKNLV